jgi:GT2 family glycosyltransferase
MSDSRIDVIILNTNRRQDTLECIASLAENTFRNFRIILLDNNSTDGTKEAVRSAFPEVQIVELSENHGYAGNNNVGIQLALEQKADWILVLNEDTILAPDSLQHLIDVGESDPSIGILGPMVYHWDEPDVIQSAGGILGPNWSSIHFGKDEVDRGQYTEPNPVEWISGCAILVRRQVVEQVGMIDPRLFIYWEETEWCMRAARAGWKIIHVPRAKIWHKGVKRNFQPKPAFYYYATRNHFYLLLKHRAPIRVWFFVLFSTFRTLVSWTVRPKWRAMQKNRDAMWLGFLDFLRKRYGGPVRL